VLDWAEKTLPQTFPAGGAGAPGLGNNNWYYLREYPGGHTLAVNAHGTPHLLYLGPQSDGKVLDLGPLSRWLDEASRDEGARSGMQVQAKPYFNFQLTLAGGPCNNFLVPHAIRGGTSGLPEGVVTTSVRVKLDGQSMEFPLRDRFIMTVLTTETDWISQRTRRAGQPIPLGMKEEPVLHGTTQGCPSFGNSQSTVDVIVFYTIGNRKGQLRTRAKGGAAA